MKKYLGIILAMVFILVATPIAAQNWEKEGYSYPEIPKISYLIVEKLEAFDVSIKTKVSGRVQLSPPVFKSGDYLYQILGDFYIYKLTLLPFKKIASGTEYIYPLYRIPELPNCRIFVMQTVEESKLYYVNGFFYDYNPDEERSFPAFFLQYYLAFGQPWVFIAERLQYHQKKTIDNEIIWVPFEQ